MNDQQILAWAKQLARGEMTFETFRDALPSAHGPPVSAELADATVDLDRQRRCGYPEVIYGQGKSADSIAAIITRLLEADQPVLATRIGSEQAAALKKHFPHARYNQVASTFRIDLPSVEPHQPLGDSITPVRVAIVTAGTTDLPVAEEARETLDWMGHRAVMIHDVGVAGPHRLPAHVETLRSCDVIIVVAGMEGALPSVVGGYVSVPVIAVPTSVGYGAAFGGVAALLGMLNSCAANVTVVNIDAGFKAGYVAGLMVRAE